MPIILDELSHAKKLLRDKSFGKYMKLKDLVLMAKYFAYLGYSHHDIKDGLRTLCLKIDRNWNETTQGWKIKVALREAKKRTIRQAIPIPITHAELESIRAVNDYALEKVLFVFLAYAKILKYNNTLVKPRRRARALGLFYTNEKASVIFSMAKVVVRKSQRQKMLHKLYELGYIDATRYDGYLIKYANEDSQTAFNIEDYDGLLLYYLRERGEAIAGCSCGRLYLLRTSRIGLCPICRKERRREAWRAYKSRSTSRDK